MRCLIVDDDPLLSDLLEHYVSKVDALSGSRSCRDAFQALNAMREEHFDFLLLDIEMPGMSGMELLQALDAEIPVIIVTSYPDFALESYHYTVVDYLVKPFDFSRFYRAVHKVFRLHRAHTATGPPAELFVKEGRDLVKVELKDVCYIEAASNYVTFVTEAGTRMVLSSLKALESRLPDTFMRVHRSYIVNAARIDKIESALIYVGKRTIPLSNQYRARLLRYLNLLV